MTNIAINLDLSQIDTHVINYAYQYTEHTKVSHIHFIHNLIPSDLAHIWEDYMADIDIEALIYKRIQNSVSAYFTDFSNISIHITQNEQSEAAIKEICVSNQIKMIFNGWKTEENGSGAMAQKLLRIQGGTYFFIPEKAAFSLKNIVIASDLSSPFLPLVTTLEKQNVFAADSHTTVVRAFNISAMFFPMVKDDKLESKTQKHLEKQFADLKKKHAVLRDFAFVAQFQDSKKVVEVIQGQCKTNKANLLCLAAKGDSKLRSILIGSLTNKILNTEPFTPLVIVQNPV